MKSRRQRPFDLSTGLLSTVAAVFLVVASISLDRVEAQSNPAQIAGLALDALQEWYNVDTGLWDTTGWWNSANALFTLIDHAKRTQNTTWDWCITNTLGIYSKTEQGFLDDYYDDEGWWALTLLEAYLYTNTELYLEKAEYVFADMLTGWDETSCGGGLWWSKARTYKNAIANELFLSVSSQLYLITKNETYLDWATKEWTWFKASGMINPSGLINDGLTISSTNASECVNNNQTAWSYNQGVILGGLTNLFEATSDSSYVSTATMLANASTTSPLLVQDGILVEPCEATGCGADGPQFKGIYVRNLAYFIKQTNSQGYFSFLTNNANSIWSNDQQSGPRNQPQLGLKWRGPFDQADAARQSSALDALNAVIV